MVESPVVFIAYDAGEPLGYFASREPAEATAEAYRAAWLADHDSPADHIEVREVPLRTTPRLPIGSWDPQLRFDELTPEEQVLATLAFGRAGDETEPAVTEAIDLPADLNTEDDDGRHFARVSRAVDPSRVVVGAVLLTGVPGAAELSRVVEVSDGVAYFVEATDETRQRVWAAAPDEEASDE